MSDSYNGDDVYAILRQLEAAQAPQAEAPRPTSQPTPTVTPALANIPRAMSGPPMAAPQPVVPPSAQTPQMPPYATAIQPQRPAGSPDGTLSNRLRETLAQDAIPSDGESLRQQILSLGAAMASSQSRSFAGALGEGVTAAQARDQQQQTNRRQLLATESEAQFREAQMRVQQARLALEEDPNSPENRARLMTAEANMLAARARMAGAGAGSSRASMVPGSYMPNPDGTVSVVVQDRHGGLRTEVVPGMTRENMPGAEQRAALIDERRIRNEDRDLARQDRAFTQWATERSNISQEARAIATGEGLIGPRYAQRVQELTGAWERNNPRPGAGTPRPAAPAEGGTTPRRVLDFNQQ